MAKGLRGRPPKLTPESQAKVVTAIAAGNYREVAAQYAGISKGTFYHWMELGESQAEGKYKDFFDSVKKAEADAEAGSVAIIRKAAVENWQAAAWYLERKHPDRWAKKETIRLDIDLRREVERIAQEQGLDPAEVLKEADAVLKAHKVNHNV